jgi:hypothetical protein
MTTTAHCQKTLLHRVSVRNTCSCQQASTDKTGFTRERGWPATLTCYRPICAALACLWENQLRPLNVGLRGHVQKRPCALARRSTCMTVYVDSWVHFFRERYTYFTYFAIETIWPLIARLSIRRQPVVFLFSAKSRNRHRHKLIINSL